MIKNILPLFALSLTLWSCQEKPAAIETSDASKGQALWVDATSTYLPVTAEWTNRVEVADINADGLIDLLFANGGNYSEPGEPEFSRVFLNQGPDKQFREVTADIFGNVKFISRVIKVRDINADGIADIIVGTTYQTQTQLYLGVGAGQFRNVTETQFPKMLASVGDVELGDVDLDGDLDIVLADWGPGSNMNNAGGNTLLWLNDGNGFFTDVTATQMPDLPIQFSWDVEFLDFDNDFDLDIVVSCKRCGTSRAFVNDGKGIFQDKRLLPAYTNNYDFEAMDLNGDGFLDLVTVNDGEIVEGESDSRREHVFLNQEGERFVDATHASWPDEANIGKDDNNILFLDYDSDGDPDFLISSLTGEDRLLVNDGSGQFSLMQPVLVGDPTPLTLSMVLGDINSDNKMDIIMGQGEGKEGIEERIFLGSGIAVDTAPPLISQVMTEENESTGKIMVRARIHDNKSPNMPQDWTTVELIHEGDSRPPVPMTWYGENLWYASINQANGDRQLSICATDASGNKICRTLE